MAFLWKATNGEKVQFGVEAVYSLTIVEKWYRNRAKKRPGTNFTKNLDSSYTFMKVAEGTREEMMNLKKQKIKNSRKIVLNRTAKKRISSTTAVEYAKVVSDFDEYELSLIAQLSK